MIAAKFSIKNSVLQKILTEHNIIPIRVDNGYICPAPSLYWSFETSLNKPNNAKDFVKWFANALVNSCETRGQSEKAKKAAETILKIRFSYKSLSHQ